MANLKKLPTSLSVSTLVSIHNGENMGTKSPYGSLARLTESGRSLDETDTYCYNSGDNRLVKSNVFTTSRVALPSWLSVDEYATNHITWDYFWGRDAKFALLTEDEQRYLITLERTTQVGIGRLLKVKKFRSSFRESMAKQVREFMATPADERKYNSPLSHKQLSYICPQSWQVEQDDSGTYRSSMVGAVNLSRYQAPADA